MSSRSWRAWALSWHGASCLGLARRPSRYACPAAQGWRRPRGNGMNGGLAMQGSAQLTSARAVQCAARRRRHSMTGCTTVVSHQRVGAPRACCGWLAQECMNRAAKGYHCLVAARVSGTVAHHNLPVPTSAWPREQTDRGAAAQVHGARKMAMLHHMHRGGGENLVALYAGALDHVRKCPRYDNVMLGCAPSFQRQ